MSTPPGRFFDVGGCRLHLWQQGMGSPTVVFESGLAGSLLSWSLVQPEVARFTSVCSYDRAGLGWSEACSAPRRVEQMVSELATLLQRAHITPPYILVGHSFGGLLIRAYAHLRPSEVAGLVFVDPVSLKTWSECEADDRARLHRGSRLARRGAWLARLGVVRLALWMLVSIGPRVPKLIANLAARRGTGMLERLTSEVGKLPPEARSLVRYHWSRPKPFLALASYLECLPEAAAQAIRMPLPPRLPFVTLSASTSTEAERRERESWMDESHPGEQIEVGDAGHWIQLERPDLVVAAIRRVCEQANLLKTERPPTAVAVGGLSAK